MRFYLPKWQIVNAVYYDGDRKTLEEIRKFSPDADVSDLNPGCYVIFADEGITFVDKETFEKLFVEQKGPLTEQIVKRRLELREMGLTDMQAAVVSYSESGMTFAEIADAMSAELEKKMSQQSVRAHYVRGKPKVLYGIKF